MIYHVVPLDDWLAVPERPYAPRGLADEGFILCAPDEGTALAIADASFRDTVCPLMVLMIDEGSLDVPVRWEPSASPFPTGSGPGALVPHVYGHINRSAVAGMLEVQRDGEGRATGLAVWS
jgi:uncharacterized protein (DUF952 family)